MTKDDEIYVWISGAFSLLAVLVTFLTVLMHLKNYKRPDLQRSTIRILMMTPIYSVISWVAVMNKGAADYLDVVRDVYEAFVIYVFFSFLVNLMDGERSLLQQLRNRAPTPPTFPFNFFLRPLDVGNPYTFLYMKRGILQFTLLKPILALLILLLKICGTYQEGLISWGSPYVYIALIYNASVCMAMYYLLMFFFTIKDDVKAHEPTSKLFCVKAVVFFSFWQGVLLSALTFAEVIKGENPREVATFIQDFIICIEMFVASLAHTFAFGHVYYEELNSGRMPLKYAVRDAFGIQDVFQDSYETILGVNGSSHHGNSDNHESSLMTQSTRIIKKANIFDLLRNLVVLFTSRPAFDINDEPLLLNASARYSEYSQIGRDISEYDCPSPINPLDAAEDLSICFPDIDPTSEIETLYRQSRSLIHGDYNYPVISSAPSLRSINNPFNRTRMGSSRQKSSLDTGI